MVMLILNINLVEAQNVKEDSDLSIFTTSVVLTDINPKHPFGSLMTETPFYIGSFKKDVNSLTVNYTMANLWGPEVRMHYPQNLTPQQIEQIAEINWAPSRATYFQDQLIETQTNTFSTDGVLQSLSFNYVIQHKNKGTFIFNLSAFLLSGGGSPLHYLVSDDFIERVHTAIDLEDNFGRKLYPYNRANIYFKDRRGREFNISNGSFYLGTLDTHYYHSIYRKEKEKSVHSLQVGGHLTLPLNSYYQKVSVGLSSSLSYRQMLSNRTWLDLGLEGLLTKNDLITLNDQTAQLTDAPFRKNVKLFLGFNIKNKRKNKLFYFGFLTNYQDFLLEGSSLDNLQIEYETLGVEYLSPADTWNGVVIQNEFNKNKLTPASMYYFSLKTYFIFGWKTVKSDLNFILGNDLKAVNNAPDFQIGIGYTFFK